MSTNKHHALKVLREAYSLPHAAPIELCENMIAALEEAGLLAPAPQVIRTVEELEALDPETRLVTTVGRTNNPQEIMDWMEFLGLNYLPAAVIATGDQVRAVREVLKGQEGEGV